MADTALVSSWHTGFVMGAGGLAEASTKCGGIDGGSAAAGVMVVRGGGKGLDMSWKFPGFS